MPKMIIDGQELTVSDGTSVIQAAHNAGIDVPYYCWHPRLSIAANCRMCLVQVEGARKLMPACELKAKEGMVVHTHTKEVLEAREAVMEFLLVNHPIDCPICDQAGECKLQNYYMKHDRSGSRFEHTKVEKTKHEVLGSTVVLDQERCVNCTRCVRFMDEIAENPLLGQFDRGDRATIGTFPGKPLEDPYSLNVVDICPVGALTSRDFRFKVRSWFLKSTDSICPGCSKGCNTVLDHHNNEIQRIRARDNDAVNQGWLCDEGRMTYKRVHDKTSQILTPFVRTDDGVHMKSTREDALKAVRNLLQGYTKQSDGKLALAVSAQETTESITAFMELAHRVLRVDSFCILGRPEGEADKLLREKDKNPNRRGAEWVFEAYAVFDEGQASLERRMRSGEIRTLIVLGHDADFSSDTFESALQNVDLICLASNSSKLTVQAKVVLPLSTYAEQEGTFVNSQGRIQRIHAAMKPISAVPGGYAMASERLSGVEWATKFTEALGSSEKLPAQWVDAFRQFSERSPLLRDVDPTQVGKHGLKMDRGPSAAQNGDQKEHDQKEQIGGTL